MSFPPGTEMFQFPGFASTTYEFSDRSPCGGVSPFGHPRINDRSHLPAAFRSVPRPSSPPGAKASTERSFLAREPTAAARAQDQTAPDMALATPGPFVQPTDDNSTYLPQPFTHTMNATPQPHDPKGHARRTNVHQILFTVSKNMPDTGPKGPHQETVEGSRHHIAMAPQPGNRPAEQHLLHAPPMTDRAARQCRAGRFSIPPEDFAFGELEASGFEPLTPCLQSRCSTN